MTFSLLPGVRAHLFSHYAVLAHPEHAPLLVDLRTGDVEELRSEPPTGRMPTGSRLPKGVIWFDEQTYPTYRLAEHS